MIGPAEITAQQLSEIMSLESSDEQYERLGIDRDACWDHLLSMGARPETVAGILGGMCMGLEFAKKGVTT